MKYQITQSSQTEPSEGQLGRNKNYREKTSTINPMGIQPLYIKKKKEKETPQEEVLGSEGGSKKKKRIFPNSLLVYPHANQLFA
jgi:hypothetical protein